MRPTRRCADRPPLAALFLVLPLQPAPATAPATAPAAPATAQAPAAPAPAAPAAAQEAATHAHRESRERGVAPIGAAGPARWGPPPGSGARTHRVGPGGEFASIDAALEAASPWDTVRVEAGTYPERLRVRRPVLLLGVGGPVIDGGGEGHVIEAEAPLELRGFVVRGSGIRVDTEDAGLMVRGAPARVEENLFEDVFYGVYLKEAPRSVVRANRVSGKPLPITRRGDGIRLWHSSGTEIASNEVVGARDVVVFFSDSLLVTDNVIRSGRYGLHYMYSHHNRFLRNRFEGNQVGAFIMYSRDVELRDNVFAAANGPGGMGLGLRDADAIRARGNLFVENAVGIHLDNSPSGRDVVNRFRENLLIYNGTGVRVLPSVRDNLFEANDFIGNGRPASVAGGASSGHASQNRWVGNHWDGYAGFDRDGDGVGDTPYAHARLADHLLGRHPELELFALSPALRLVDALGRFFPLLRPEPVVVDSAPRLTTANLSRWERRPPVAAAALGGPSPPGAERTGWEGTDAGPRAEGAGRGSSTALGAVAWLVPGLLALGLACRLARDGLASAGQPDRGRAAPRRLA